MHLFIIHDHGHPLLMETMEHQLRVFLGENNVHGTVRWYYDEFVEDGTEYGVRIDVSNMSSTQWDQFKEEVLSYCVSLHGDSIWVQVA